MKITKTINRITAIVLISASVLFALSDIWLMNETVARINQLAGDSNWIEIPRELNEPQHFIEPW